VNLSYPTTIEAVDTAFLFIFAVSLVMLLGITATMVCFLVKYNRRRCPVPLSQTDKNLWLEIVWTVIPTLLVLGMFWYGWEGYLSLQRIPENAMEVKASARMWSWTFTYEGGRTSDRLVVPVGRPVKVRLESEDVLHSFYIPAFRIKRDCVPGMTTWAWFVAEHPGSYDIFCAEYCGVGHAAMITSVEAISAHEFVEWLRQESPAEEAAEGERLLAKYGCTACHSLDGGKGVGPTFQGLFGRPVTVMTDGKKRTLATDADYIRRSVLQPLADLVEGFPPVMPAYAGQMPEHDLEEILEYFVKAGAGGKERGKTLLQEKGCLGCHSLDGTPRVGPTFQGIFGRRVTVEKGGEKRSLTADTDYLRESISAPAAAVVEGFPPVMPAYADLAEEDLEAIVDYLRDLR